ELLAGLAVLRNDVARRDALRAYGERLRSALGRRLSVERGLLQRFEVGLERVELRVLLVRQVGAHRVEAHLHRVDLALVDARELPELLPFTRAVERTRRQAAERPDRAHGAGVLAVIDRDELVRPVVPD